MMPLFHKLKTTTTTKPKRKRGDRKGNLYPDKACYVITEVRPAGEILEPKELRGLFRNTIGALVRDKLNPAIPNWKEVPGNTKNALWDRQLKVNFRFPEGKQELVKMLSRSWESHSDVGGWSSTRSISKRG